MKVFSEYTPKEVGKKVEELGQFGAAKFFQIPRPTLRDFLYRNGLPTRQVVKELTLKERQEKAAKELILNVTS